MVMSAPMIEEQIEDQLLQECGDARLEERWPSRGVLEVSCDQSIGVGAPLGEGVPSGNDLEEHDTQGIEVALCRGRPPAQDLGGGVAEAAKES